MDVQEAVAAHALREHNVNMEFVVFFFKKGTDAQPMEWSLEGAGLEAQLPACL
jgi:hypothetical protein